MRQIAKSISKFASVEEEILPLENGDHLTADEFLKRYSAMPDLKKAELINGQVYITTDFSAREGATEFPLQNGDHLTAEEFIKRYDATVGINKAELIEGVVYVSPPVSHFGHSVPHQNIGLLVGIYRLATPGTSSGDNGSVWFDGGNMPQPDLCLFILPTHGGHAAVRDDDYLTGPIDLVVEVASSSASVDMHQKRDIYERGGVREYIIWKTRERAIEYLILREGKFVPLVASEGIFKSEAFPGLRIDSASLTAGDLPKAMDIVQAGIASPEHAAFVSLLQKRAGTAK